MRFAVALALALASDAPWVEVVPAAERTVGGRVIDVCLAWEIPGSAVGEFISIKGRVHSDIEGSWIYGDACPDKMVRLSYAAASPSLVGCLAGNGHVRCGGLRRNEQLVVVTGLLKMKGSVQRTLQGLPLAAAEVQVVGFRAVE